MCVRVHIHMSRLVLIEHCAVLLAGCSQVRLRNANHIASASVHIQLLLHMAQLIHFSFSNLLENPVDNKFRLSGFGEFIQHLHSQQQTTKSSQFNLAIHAYNHSAIFDPRLAFTCHFCCLLTSVINILYDLLWQQTTLPPRVHCIFNMMQSSNSNVISQNEQVQVESFEEDEEEVAPQQRDIKKQRCNDGLSPKAALINQEKKIIDVRGCLLCPLCPTRKASTQSFDLTRHIESVHCKKGATYEGWIILKNTKGKPRKIKPRGFLNQ
jgi:hypothetical protein